MGSEMLSKNLEALRVERGYTKRAVAEGSGITYGSYCGYEYGRRDPDTETLSKIAKFYGCTVDELLGIEKAPDNTEPMVTRDQLVEFLLSAGLINEGEDLSDSDLHFLEALIAAAAEWFSAKNA